MHDLPRTARWYLYGIWSAAAVCAMTALAAAPSLRAVPLLAVGLVAFVMADMFAVSFELRENDHFLMTVTDTVQVFLAGTVGPLGVIVPVAGSLLSDGLVGRPWYKGLFNAAQRCLGYLAIAYVYVLVVGPGPAPFAGWRGLLGIALMVAVYLSLNTLLVSAIVALVAEEPLLKVYASSLGQVQWVHLITLPLGAVLAVIYYYEPWMLVPALVPLLMAYRSFRAMASLQAESRKSKDLADKLERLQDTTTAMLSSDEPQPLLELVSERLAALLGATAVWVILDEREPRVVAVRGVDDPGAIDVAGSVAELRHRTVRETAGGPPWPAVLHIPMLAGGRLLGGFCLAVDEALSLADDDRRVLLAFAAQAAVAVERTQLSDQLRTKQEELLRTSKLAAMGTMAAGIAHEFNNLLTAIGGFAQLGLTSADPAEKDEALDVALRTSIRGQSITAGLLTFARRRESRRELCQVRDVADETLVLVERQLAKANIAVRREYEPIPPTFCDAGQIAQVVMNLITNARDAMAEARGGTLVLGLRERGGQIELRVSDTGVGIPEDLLTEIFKPFMTTKAALDSGDTPGTGLGLAITHNIVEGHSGAIEVLSKLGQGTTVLVRLPVLTAREEAERQAQGEQRAVSA